MEEIEFYNEAFDVTLTKIEEWQIGRLAANDIAPLKVIRTPEKSFRFQAVSLFDPEFVHLTVEESVPNFLVDMDI